MDWSSLLVGAIVGALAGIILQNIAYPAVERRWRAHRRHAFYSHANKTWTMIEHLYPRLKLVQGGWGEGGCFAEGSIVLRLVGSFALKDPEVKKLRGSYVGKWKAAGFTDDEQLGIDSILNTRVSDSPSAEIDEKAHTLTLNVHRYRYFDFLATHMLRLRGNAEERSALNRVAGPPSSDRPVPGFPTPCSVGLSVFCEDGTQLVLTRRTAAVAVSGDWESGKIFNAVGENATLRDFAASNREPHETTPEVIARRGVHEELGFNDSDIRTARLRLHSFAWANDVLDFKFFGTLETPLASAEIQDRWRNAPDRSESSGEGLMIWPVQSHAECRQLLATIRDNPSDWSPEAIFSTLRSLIVLRKISTEDVRQAMSANLPTRVKWPSLRIRVACAAAIRRLGRRQAD